MEDFPKLTPAFTVMLVNGPIHAVGATAQGHIRSVAVEKGGSIKTAEGFDGPEVDATFVYGADFMKIDADGGYVRLDFQGLFKTKDDQNLQLNMQGHIQANNEETGPLFAGDPEAKSTGFGSGFLHATIEAGNEKYKGLENFIYVGASRMIVEKGEPINVEFRFSRVGAGRPRVLKKLGE